MYWSDEFTSTDIVQWILFAVNDPHTIDRETLIENALQYGRSKGVSKKQIQKALRLPLQEMFLSAGIRKT